MNKIELPTWLDDYIFKELDARYCRCYKDMVVIDWNKSNILNYLGTYFPRSYAESYTIFSNYFKENKQKYDTLKEINIFDFGCGTGGEIVGILFAINELLPNIEYVFIEAMDGNAESLRILEKVINKYSYYSRVSLEIKVLYDKIDDFYDLAIVNEVLDKQFDFIITFKAICEFVTRQQFETRNPYEFFIITFAPKLSNLGLICITDITSYNEVSKNWLPIMMNKAIKNSKAILVKGNSGYNESFMVSHSKKKNDLSKIAWRLLTQKQNITTK